MTGNGGSCGQRLHVSSLTFSFLLCARLVSSSSTPEQPILSFTFTADRCRNDGIISSYEGVGDSDIKSVPVQLLDVEGVCRPSFGIQATNSSRTDNSKSISSESETSHEFLPGINSSNGLSFELWIKTPQQLVSETVLQPIFTIGKRSINATAVQNQKDEDISDCGRNQVFFQLAQRNNALQVMYKSSDTFFEPCQRSNLNFTVESSQLLHVVASLRDREQRIYINRQLVATLSRPWNVNDVLHWHLNSTLSLFSFFMSTESTIIWPGTTYRLAIYNSFLVEENVTELIRVGLPRSLPVSWNNSMISIYEDAEIEPASHLSSWYAQQAPTDDAQAITLGSEWVDQMVADLQYTALSSETMATILPLRPSFTYVTQLPARGCLYQTDGTLMGCGVNDTHSLVLIPVLDQENDNNESARLVYLPPLNQHSEADRDASYLPFATIGYCVSDKVLVSADQCLFMGSLHVRVLPVNDPPIATSTGPFRVSESLDSISSPSILLTGSDADIGDTIEFVQITVPPKKGRLMLKVTKFRPDHLLHRTPLDEIEDYLLASSSSVPVVVQYVWNPPSSVSTVVQGLAMSDSFRFRVVDNTGAWSQEETVHIKIVSSVLPSSPPFVEINEDYSGTEANLQWFANDSSGYKRPLQYWIKSVPGSNVGVLRFQDRVVHSGESLDLADSVFPYTQSVNLTFHPARDYCTSIGEGLNDRPVAIQFHVVARNLDHIVSVSDPMIQFIHIVCKRDPLVVTIPPGPFHLSALTLHAGAATSRNSRAVLPHTLGKRENLVRSTNSYHNTEEGDAHSLVIVGIRIYNSDSDKPSGSNRVNVTISTHHGYLTFNRTVWRSSVYPMSGRDNFASGSITFSVPIADLESVLINFTYSTYTPGNDSITIDLDYDPTDHPCSISLERGVVSSNIRSPDTSCNNERRHDPFHYHYAIRITADTTPPPSPETRLVSNITLSLLQLFLSMICYPALFLLIAHLEDTWWNRSNTDTHSTDNSHGDSDDNDDDNDDDDKTEVDESDVVWIQYQCPESGNYYYQNRTNGTTTWMAPVGEPYIVADSGDNDHDKDEVVEERPSHSFV